MKRLLLALLALAACQPRSEHSEPKAGRTNRTLWQDYDKLRLVCFWKTSATESDAKSPRFPPANRKDVPYESKELMKQRDISASFFVKITPSVELMVQSLLQDDARDQAVVTTRLSYADKGFGDNHDVSRNTSGHNFVRIEPSMPGTPAYVSYACGVYELPLPAQPSFPGDSQPRVPPIH